MSRSAPVQLDVIASLTTFGDLLRYLRQRNQLTQRDLALATGYSISQISRLEHNERLPDELTLLAVFVPALGVEQEPATVERLLLLARWARIRGAGLAAPREASRETADPIAPQAAPRVTNLPHRLTSFIGREQEIETLQRLVAENRLITLTGVGGVGKSSLALAVANPLTFPDGVWLLELAPISEAGLVTRLLVDLFKLPEFPGRTPLEAVISYVQPKALLLIVDNCEHLIATCADLVDRLLRASAKIHILATSREALNITDEHEWPVLPLSTPPHAMIGGPIESLQQLQPFAAAQLFIERAQTVKADLIFTEQDAPLIAHLCQQVDGLPLALELAAARCKSLALPELVARLHDRFALLSAGRRTALLRHQTLRATIDWSYDLLSPAEAALFRCLSVFVGGWTVAAAEQVAVADQRHLPTFELLHQLVNKSLVVVDQRGETTRYGMLETIRQYAQEQLASFRELKSTQRCHADYFVLLAKSAETEMRSFQLKCWLDRMETEHNNVRAALTWALEVGDITTGLELCGALRQFWGSRGHVLEAQGWLKKLLAVSVGVPITVQAKARITAGLLEFILGNTDTAEIFFQQSLNLYQKIGNSHGEASALMELGNIYTAQGNYAQALVFFQQSLNLYYELNDTWGIAVIHIYLGSAAAEQGNYVQANAYLETGLKLSRDLGDPVWIGNALNSLAIVAGEQHEYQKATAYFAEILAQERALEDKIGIAYALNNLGRLMLYLGDFAQATIYLAESFALAQGLGIPRLMGFALANQGNVAFEQGEYDQATYYYTQSLEITHHSHDPLYTAILFERLACVTAAQKKVERTIMLLGAAATLRKTIGIPLLILDQPRHHQIVESVRIQLDEVTFATAWAKGEDMTLEEAIVYALGKALPR